MPSLFPGFEYDIFISYRQNDNARGWVTGFAKNLAEELAATIKEPLSIYFDANPVDGLLETHQVDKSLEGKLKCVILIPIVSQTYCDPKCFAWSHEFLAFNRMAKSDSLGRDIKLASKNVASRILPVKIHDLDTEDRVHLETELEGPIRSVEFIYKSSGVNRPLSPTDNPDKNINKTYYRDQVNKVANAVKEIIYAIKYPDRILDLPGVQGENGGPVSDAKVTPTGTGGKSAENSIAVLPFVNLSQDPSQEYFADGVMENILIQLASLRQLWVISRTSVMRYRKTTKSAPEIADELHVKYILEGSAQSHGTKVRIQVQLIDAQHDHQVWGKVFVENLDDIFAIQNSVAEVVVRELRASLQPTENEKLKEIPTRNLKAFDLFLKGRHAFNQWNLEGYRTAEKYFLLALQEDPEFVQAYSYLASTYSALMSWNGDLSPAESLKKINIYLPEATRRGGTDRDCVTQAVVEFFVNKNFHEAQRWLLKAMEAGPNNADVLQMYSYLLSMMGKPEEALNAAEKGKVLDPTSVSSFNYPGIAYYLMRRYEEAMAIFREGLQLYPHALRLYDHVGRLTITTGKYEEAVQVLEMGLKTTTLRPPSMVAYLAIAHAGLGHKEKCNDLLEELLGRSMRNEKGVNIYVTHVYHALGDDITARTWLDKARASNDIDLIWYHVDPLLKTLREGIEHPQPGGPDYDGAENFIRRKLENELPSSLQYHNTEHIQDVLDSAMAIAKGEALTSEQLHLLRIAALFHDSGLMISRSDHEKHGCALAREILPSFGLTPGQIEIICGMIMATRIPQSPRSLLENILCDADLDYLGRSDFFEIGAKLRAELKDGGLIETEREWNTMQKAFLEAHQYHTAFSRANRESVKKQHLKEITARLKA